MSTNPNYYIMILISPNQTQHWKTHLKPNPKSNMYSNLAYPPEIKWCYRSPMNSALLHQQVVLVVFSRPAMPLISQMHLLPHHFFHPQVLLALGILHSPCLPPVRRHFLFKPPYNISTQMTWNDTSSKMHFFLPTTKGFLFNISLLSPIQQVPDPLPSSPFW